MSAGDWVVVGSGGHGKEVAGVIQEFLLQDGARLLGFLDDNPQVHKTMIAGLPVLGPLEWLRAAPRPIRVAIAIGSSPVRKKIFDRLRDFPPGITFPVIRHPSATLGARVVLGEGTLVQAGVIITCDVTIGPFSVLNIATSVSHDCEIGAFVNLHPGVRLAGGVKISDMSDIGMGTHVIQLITVGESARTGALAAVVRPLPAGVTAVGVPAHKRTTPREG